MTYEPNMAEMEYEDYLGEVLEMGATEAMLAESLEDEDEMWAQYEAEVEADRIRSESELAEALEMMENIDWLAGLDF